jgi:uncharacterized OB-fold protein
MKRIEADETLVPQTTVEDFDVHLVGSRCPDCDDVAFPELDLCRRCGTPTENHTFDREAELVTFTSVHVAPEPFETPYVVGFVRLSPGSLTAFTPLVADKADVDVGASVVPTLLRFADNSTSWGFTTPAEVSG